MTSSTPLAALLLALATALPAQEAGPAAAPPRPNILWITAEDMSPRIGPYGDATVPTPNLDRLASEGVRYTHAFAVYGVCAPSRHALIMGMYPTSTGAMAMRTWKRTAALDQITDPELLAIPTYEATPPPEAHMLSEYLQRIGYYTCNNHKEDYQFRTPAGTWNDSSRHAHWRHRPRAEMPFFAVFNLNVTHESKIFERTSPRVTDPDRVELPPYYPDTPIVRRDVARQYDNIAVLDRQVGELLAELKADGLDRSTVVFFFSDHGDGLPRAKRWVYDSGTRVPLIIRYPDRHGAGTATDRLVSFVDFAPTVLSLAGEKAAPHMEGVAFAGPCAGPPRRYVFTFRDRMDPAPERIRAVRDRRYQYVRNYRPELPYVGFIPYRDRAGIMQDILRLAHRHALGPDQWQLWAESKPLEELYDIEADPHQIHNLAANPYLAVKLHELRAAHGVFVARFGDLGRMPETELVEHLWGPTGQQPQTAPPTAVLQPGPDGARSELRCPTAGATIAYRLRRGGPWRLYLRPLALAPGTEILASAHRIGFRASPVVLLHAR